MGWRIRIKSVPHYVRCIDALKEWGVQFPADDTDELLLRRLKRRDRKAWLYIGGNKVGWLFRQYSVVQYAEPVTRKEMVCKLKQSVWNTPKKE